jgi:integrase
VRLFQRNRTWWADFSVNGQRFRQSLDTTDGRKAHSIANQRLALAEQGNITQSGQSFARLAFGEAADRYLAGRRMELEKLSHAKERQLLVKLREYFQARPLNRVKVDDVLGYREWRSGQSVGPAIINMEIGVLRRILKRAKRWHLIAEDVKPLREPRTIGRALSLEEKLRLLKTACQKPEWETAYWAAILALNTTMRGCELKGLRWADVNLIDRTLSVGKSKTEAGERLIPLTPDAFDTLLKLRKRAEMFGPVEAGHFVFAWFRPKFRLKSKPGMRGGTVAGMEAGNFDPTRPVGSWRTAWRTLRAAASKGDKEKGIPEMLQLANLRFHDLRHHAITDLAESGAIEQSIMAIAGHVSRKVLERYSHVRLEAKRHTIQALARTPLEAVTPQTPVGGHGTSNGTKSELESPILLQVLESNGRPVGTRTPDLYRVKVAL